MYEEVQG